jgi:hypothetical protein
MLRVYNWITNDMRYINSYNSRLDSDLILFEEFKQNLIEKKDFNLTRQYMIERVSEIKEKEVGVNKMIFDKNKFKELESNYFKTDELNLDKEMTDLLLNSCVDGIKTPIAPPNGILVYYLKQKIKLMTDIDYSFFIEMISSWKQFVYFLLQPVLLIAEGVENFLESSPYLLSGKNFLNLIEKIKLEILNPESVYLKFYDQVPKPYFTSSLLVDNIWLITSSLIIILSVCYVNFKPQLFLTAAAAIKNANALTVISSPKISKTVKYSNYLNKSKQLIISVIKKKWR